MSGGACCSPSRGASTPHGDSTPRDAAASVRTDDHAGNHADNHAGNRNADAPAETSATKSADTSAGTPGTTTASANQQFHLIEGGTFNMGTSDKVSYPADGEHHVHQVHVDSFEISNHAVSNERFAEFVASTSYVTEAERFGWAFVFAGLLPDDFPDTRAVADAPWWRQVFGADWAHPEGPHSDVASRLDHPVVQVSHNDALEFCEWENSRLPTEAEWEFAARGGIADAIFPWGNELEPNGTQRMNVWQGSFPDNNTCADGYYGTAPVDAFEPNGFQLYNTCGNVWEWCSDWFAVDYYTTGNATNSNTPSAGNNPAGPSSGAERVMRGGSYLCHASYCHRYRVAARSSNGPDSAAGNLGFRTARSKA